MNLLRTLTCVFILSGLAHATVAQSGRPLSPINKREFRGAWIATVINLDWPQSSIVATQQQQLIDILDELKAAGINAVFFQIRAESDALYDSPIDPWSIWLTGAQGRPPSPYYDPLEFAIEEAHRRGMELHAWINPYRAERNRGNYSLDSTHVVRRHPEWLISISNISITNPGLPEVREYIISVIEDVVTRYDVDGIHFDDFFYPYPPNHIASQDQQTFIDNNPLAFTTIEDWRRWSVNQFIEGVADAIAAIKPNVKFGVSPFGIWKNGVPAGIVGLDAYNVIFSDPVEWMNQQWLDYLTPQLYWAFGGGQDYAKLAPWWASVRNGRHLYPGHGLYRSDRNSFSGTLFGASEVANQVRFNRTHGEIDGSVYFRARNITTFRSMGFADSLKIDLNRHPALVPTMEWRDNTLPNVPNNVAFAWTDAAEVTISWDPPLLEEGVPDPRRYAVYRIRSAGVPDFATALENPSNLLKVTGETSVTDYPEAATDPYYYVVTSVSMNSVESFESDFVIVEGRAVSVEGTPPLASFNVSQNYPNPFSDGTSIVVDLSIAARVHAQVYNAIGQQVAVIADGEVRGPGEHVVSWDGRDASGARVASGTYFYAVEADGRRVTRPMVVVR